MDECMSFIVFIMRELYISTMKLWRFS